MSRSMNQMLEEIASLSESIDPLANLVRSLREKRDEIRNELRDRMIAEGVGRMDGEDVQAVIRRSSATVIADMAAIEDFLKSSCRVEEFRTWDEASIKRVGKREGWGGLHTVRTASLVIRDMPKAEPEPEPEPEVESVPF